jgi:hypothetical protein
MHVSELAELAAVVAVHTSSILAAERRFPASQLERYWTIAKCRLDRWGRAIRAVPQDDQHPFTMADTTGHKALIEEILTSEVLTRVWTAAITAHDRQYGLDDAEPLARSIFLGHQELRNRVLRWMISGRQLSPRQLDSLNVLRRRMERWIDALLAHLAPVIDISPWVIDRERAADFTQDLRENPSLPHITIEYVTTSIRAASRADAAAISPNGDLNQKLAATIVSCLPHGCVNAAALPLPLWIERLSNMAEETQDLLDELYLLEGRSDLESLR